MEGREVKVKIIELREIGRESEERAEERIEIERRLDGVRG